jgi:predicted thioesterase
MASDSAIAFGSGTVDVFGTPSMVAFMENTCKNCVQLYLVEGEGTVGIALNIRHLAAAPIGATVKCECELIEVERTILTFTVKVSMGDELIGDGTHTRARVDFVRFQAKADEKRKSMGLS